MVKIKKNIGSIAMILPAFILFTCILIYPSINAIYLSFFRWNGILQSKMDFIFLSNYMELLQDKHFWLTLRNVMIFILQGIFIQGPIAFGLALIISSKIKAARFFKVSFFMPTIIPLTAIALMWTFLIDPKIGIINETMKVLGLGPQQIELLGNPSYAIYTVVLISAWVYSGMNMILFSAGMTSIPEDIYEAAEIDGATGFKKTMKITVPLLAESFKIYFILVITGALKSFDLIFVLTQGGPNYSTQVPGVLLYTEAFSNSRFGYGSAIGVVILILGLVASILANKYMFVSENK